MILAMIGTVGSGKTLSMTEQAYQYYRRGFKVYANYGLNFPHTPLTYKVLMSMIKDKVQLQDCVLCLDEMQVYMDSRTSMGKKNRGISYFILQTRKRNVRLLFTTQFFGQVDLRLRRCVDVLVYCRNLSNTKSVVDPSMQTLILQEYFYQYDNRPPHKRVILANPLYQLYDTSEIIEWDDSDDEEEALEAARVRKKKKLLKQKAEREVKEEDDEIEKEDG